jgi:mannose-6-phosphate isomerase-like protein (cupin superfamily)
MSEGHLLQPGEGELHTLGPSSKATLKATADATAGRFFLSECEIAPGFAGPPPHVHSELVDSFYVLEGTLTITIGQELVELGPGGFACALPGERHTFANRSGEIVRFLNINAPGGFEQYMRELAAAATTGPITSERIGEIASRYDLRGVD